MAALKKLVYILFKHSTQETKTVEYNPKLKVTGQAGLSSKSFDFWLPQNKS